MRVTISTCLDIQTKELINKNHWKVPELIMLGIKTRLGQPEFNKRITELEMDLKRSKETNQKLAQKIYMMTSNAPEGVFK